MLDPLAHVLPCCQDLRQIALADHLFVRNKCGPLLNIKVNQGMVNGINWKINHKLIRVERMQSRCIRSNLFRIYTGPIS